MTFDDVKKYAKSLINFTGSDTTVNNLENACKAVVLNSHLWERFFKEMDVAYPAGTGGLNLDASNSTKVIYKIIAIRFEDGSYWAPPDYITPDEYNRIVNDYADPSIPTQYTMIGRSLRLIGAPSSSVTLTITYTRDPANVNWSEMSDDYLDYSGTVLARMLTAISSVAANGYPVANPAYVQLKALEQSAFRKLLGIEYRQPGRKYEIQQDEMRTIRYEQFDY